MDNVKFGTSGLRGLASAFNDEVCQSYTQAFLQLIQKKFELATGRILLIGQDLRTSSPKIANSIANGALAFGWQVENCAALPTPALALAALTRQLPAIMVTGSHIPEDRNGLKFYRPDGEIDKLDEQAIWQTLPVSKPLFFQNHGLPPPNNQALDAYLTRAKSILSPHALQGLRIGIYQHSCVTRDLLGDILSKLGAQIIPFDREEKFLAIDTEALSQQDIERSIQAARHYQLDAIISTDGDGDRPLIAGHDGIYLRGDVIGLLTAKFLAADCVITPITSSSIIEDCDFFSQIYRCQVGSPYVLATMKQARANFKTIVGFEANGGVLLGSDIVLPNGNELPALPTRDALLPILATLGLAAKTGLPLHKIIATLPQRFNASGRLKNILAKHSSLFLEQLANPSAIRGDFIQIFAPIHAQNTIDGLRLTLIDGSIIHYRASGNAPELRCYSEAANQELAQDIMQRGLNFAYLLTKTDRQV